MRWTLGKFSAATLVALALAATPRRRRRQPGSPISRSRCPGCATVNTPHCWWPKRRDFSPRKACTPASSTAAPARIRSQPFGVGQAEFGVTIRSAIVPGPRGAEPRRYRRHRRHGPDACPMPSSSSPILPIPIRCPGPRRQNRRPAERRRDFPRGAGQAQTASI